MNVPLLNLVPQYESIRAEVDAAIAAVCQSQRFIMGEEVSALESEIATYCGATHAIGVSSGSDALLLSLMALDIGPGDEVITSPYTFFATVGAITRLGAHPVFVDIDPTTYNIDVTQLETKISAKTKAIIPVHLYGQMADMEPLVTLSTKYSIPIIEDAAQAIGAEIAGKRAGSIGLSGCFSFFPSKNLGAFGDGGIITTNDPAYAEKLRIMRVHGMEPKYYHKYIGGNFRLDALQATVVRVKLRHLDNWTAQRQKNAAIYRELLQPLAKTGAIQLPVELSNVRHVYNQFVISVDSRDKLREHLTKSGVGCEVYYPVPLHKQECFAPLLDSNEAFPNSEHAAGHTLALPIFPELSEEDLSYVADSIRTFFN